MDAEARGSRVQGQHKLHRETLSLKKKRKERKKKVPMRTNYAGYKTAVISRESP
jgi:hypothetical protein